ncbi:MAG: arsenosugar biosynthesis radical SAM protein ArsS [Deltaproteobacteria bacterium]|nr:arsenosugar biosynthesis radical SAM protein ArsS [Deltaproteobacteria bacterium]
MDASAIHPPFEQRAAGPVWATGIEIFQINLGYRCNLQCRHCHVEAGPNRPELMGREVVEACLAVLRRHPIPVIDITGGAPEMHPGFPWLLEACAALGRRLMVRTNGVILLEAPYAALLDLYVRRGVELVVSFPHMDPKVTNRQRGEGVYPRLIEVLRKLNEAGYGQSGSGLVLNLTHNPGGAYLPGLQASLENHYRQTLGNRHGILFNHLFCITNMPIGRYRAYLKNTGNDADYMTALVNAFNPATLESVMCKTTLSVAWDGGLYDCDFNQMLGLGVNHGVPEHIAEFDWDRLARRRVVTGDHCYGCTAGAGSSCGGEIA